MPLEMLYSQMQGHSFALTLTSTGFSFLFRSLEVVYVSDLRGGTDGELSRKQRLQVRGLGDDGFRY
jgi:hypothetical protein